MSTEEIERIDLGKVNGEKGIGIKSIVKSDYTDPQNPSLDFYEIHLDDDTSYRFSVKNATEITIVDSIDITNSEEIATVGALLDYLANFYTRGESDTTFQEKNISTSISADSQSGVKYPSVKAVEDYLENYYTKAEVDEIIGIAREVING